MYVNEKGQTVQMYGIRESYWSSQTLLFYIFIIVISYILLSPKRKTIRITKTKKTDLSFWLVFIILLSIAGFRTIGRDLNGGYYINFQQVTSISSYRDQTVEIGFILLNVIVKRIFNSYSVFVFITALITIAPIFAFAKRNLERKDYREYFLFYISTFYFTSFSAIRQYIAMSFCLMAYECIKNRNHKKALIWILIATSFHISALAMFIPYFVSIVRAVSKRMIWLSVALLLILTFLMRNSILGLFGSRYLVYASYNTVELGMRWIIYYAPIIFLLYREMKNIKNKYMLRIDTSLVAVGLMFELLGYVISILGRMSSITIPFIFSIPNYINTESRKKRKLILRIALIAYCGLRFWLFINDHYENEMLMPYESILFKLR